jgi:CubicO group peptidase (beta-lactamase class C family)
MFEANPHNWFSLSVRTGYGYQWWTRDDGTFEGRGIYGQTLHIDRSRRLVIVINSAIEQPTDRAAGQARQEFITLVGEELDREARQSTAPPGTPSHRRSR